MQDNVWNILIVDDEDDIDQVTQLALKRRTWRGRGFNLVSSRSAKEAQQLIASRKDPFFYQVMLVDVVMEEHDRGARVLRLRPPELAAVIRIILRTGTARSRSQGGGAQQLQGINHYVSKPDATAELLYALVCASLRSSLDIAMMMSLFSQLRESTGPWRPGKMRPKP